MKLKDTIVLAALELFLKYGIKSVSMDDVSQKLGISKKTVYSAIDSKDALVAEVLQLYMTKNHSSINQFIQESHDAIDEMIRITRHILEFISNMSPSIVFDLKKYHHQMWLKIEKEHFGFIEKIIFNNLIRGQREGLYRLDFNPKTIAAIYVFKSCSIADEEEFPYNLFDKMQLIKEMVFYHLHGIVSKNGLKIIDQQHKQELFL